MENWNSEQYLKFKQQRTMPAIDLANRIRYINAKTIIDIGCGPGNSTFVLKATFPNANLKGIDQSQNMIDKAVKLYPDLQFERCDAYDITGTYDVIFSNACLQWIPNHAQLLPFLMSKLNENGILAVQIPINKKEPLFQIINDVADDERWGFHQKKLSTNETLSTDEYFNILSNCASDFQMWETVYYHSMPSFASLVEWVKGTRLRPYLQVLNDEESTAFEQEILKRVSETYAIMDNGDVILRFRRLFFTAQK